MASSMALDVCVSRVAPTFMATGSTTNQVDFVPYIESGQGGLLQRRGAPLEDTPTKRDGGAHQHRLLPPLGVE